jgi:hypothetical protein
MRGSIAPDARVLAELCRSAHGSYVRTVRGSFPVQLRIAIGFTSSGPRSKAHR